jgi:hypothetical protein
MNITPERLREIFELAQTYQGYVPTEDESAAIKRYLREHDDDLAADLSFAFPLESDEAQDEILRGYWPVDEGLAHRLAQEVR